MTTKKKITKKVISKPKGPDKEESQKEIRTRCLFCREKSKPIFTDAATLKRFISDRSRITPRVKSGVCSKHQRFLARQIKYARHLALIPFTPKV